MGKDINVSTKWLRELRPILSGYLMRTKRATFNKFYKMLLKENWEREAYEDSELAELKAVMLSIIVEFREFYEEGKEI